LGFVATHAGGSIDAAEELLLYSLGERWIRWLYGRLEYKDSACTPAQLEQVRKTLLKAGLEEEMVKSYLGRELEFFWRPAEHTRIAVDRAKSEATRTGPPWVVGSRTLLELVDGRLTPVENFWPIFLTGLAPVTLTVKLFQLHHDDVATTLRRFGLLSLQKEATPQAPARPITAGTLVAVEAPDVAAFMGAPVASEPVEPTIWYDAACEANPRRANESLTEYDQRIYRLMVIAVRARAVTKQWTVETIGRERRGRK
jgi:hypothetical protein